EGTDSAVLVLSPGIELVEGSLVCLSGESDFCPVVERILPDPDHAGGSLVYLSYPTQLSDGDEVHFTFDVIAQESSACGQDVSIEFTSYVVIDGLECNGEICSEGVAGITGSDTAWMQVDHPDVEFTAFVADTIAGMPNVEHQGTLTVTRLGLAENDSLYVKIYCADAAQNPVGTAVDSILVTGPVAEGGAINFEGYFLKNECLL